MEFLPNELLQVISEFTDVATGVSFSMVNKRLRSIIKISVPWRGLFYARSCIDHGYPSLLKLATESGLVLNKNLFLHNNQVEFQSILKNDVPGMSNGMFDFFEKVQNAFKLLLNVMEPNKGDEIVSKYLLENPTIYPHYFSVHIIELLVDIHQTRETIDQLLIDMMNHPPFLNNLECVIWLDERYKLEWSLCKINSRMGIDFLKYLSGKKIPMGPKISIDAVIDNYNFSDAVWLYDNNLTSSEPYQHNNSHLISDFPLDWKEKARITSWLWSKGVSISTWAIRGLILGSELRILAHILKDKKDLDVDFFISELGMWKEKVIDNEGCYDNHIYEETLNFLREKKQLLII